MHHLARYTPLTLILLVTTGCNLTLDLDDHPYQGGALTLPDSPADLEPPVDLPPDVPDVPDLDAPHDLDTSDDAPDAPDDTPLDVDMDVDMDVEEMPVGAPQLIFTELLVDASGGDESGEYFEITNIGDAPAQVSLISITLVNADSGASITSLTIPQAGNGQPGHQEALDALLPIAPGGRFVFVKEDAGEFGIVALATAAAVYEHKRWESGSQLALSNGAYRQLRMAYRGVVHDTISWEGGGLKHPEEDTLPRLSGVENRAFELRADAYDAPDRRDPALWCLSDAPVPNSAEGLHGTPGQPPGQCLE